MLKLDPVMSWIVNEVHVPVVSRLYSMLHFLPVY